MGLRTIRVRTERTGPRVITPPVGTSIGRALRRLSIGAALVSAMLLRPSEARAQNLYPACNNPQMGSCAMSNLGPGPVLHGESAYAENAIPIYIILYGPWNDTVNKNLPALLVYLIYSMNDSSYWETLGTYSDPSGPAGTHLAIGGVVQDTAKSMGSTLTDGSIKLAIYDYIENTGQLPADPNGIYLFLPDKTVNVTSYCGPYCGSGGCGCNNNASIVPGAYLSYAVIGDATGCNTCQWQMHTPNDAGGADLTGALDGELKSIAHEIAELVTDPVGLNAGWASTKTGGNTQMADFCTWTNKSVALGTTYQVTASGLPATANFHGAGGDFLLQTLRVNEQGGNLGYCANSIGGVFWGQNFGYSHAGSDWSYGSYKGQCELGQPLVGLSEDTSSTPKAHAVMCGSGSTSADYSQNSCQLLSFDGSAGTVQWYVDPPPLGDWDTYFYKGECGKNQFVAGVSQSTSGVVNGLLCCPGSVTHSSCESQTFNSANVSPSDWDYGYLKAQCNAGQYVAGVSANTSTGSPHRILCCNP